MNRYTFLLAALLTCIFATTAQALPDVLMPLAQGDYSGGDVSGLFGLVLNIVMAALFIWAVVIVGSGAAAVSRGDEGWLKIMGGVLMAGAATIMFFAFRQTGGANPLDF